MKTEAGELKVYYQNREEKFINMELDQALEDTLKKFGYCWRASGIDMFSGARNLTFKKKAEEA